MTQNSLHPAYIKLEYQTVKALHVMTLPTREWNPGVGDNGGFIAWDDSSISVEDMVDSLVTALVGSAPTDTVFQFWTVYTIADPDNPVSIPVANGGIVDGDGIAVGAGVDAAQATWSFRTLDGGFSRLTLLDISPNTEFRPRSPGSFVAGDTAIADAWTAVTSAWAGRDGSRPHALRRVTFALNDAARHAYKYA